MFLSKLLENKLIEKVFVILSFLFFTEALFSNIREFSGLAYNLTDTITRVFFIGVKVGIIFLIVAWRKRAVRIVIKEKLLWALIGIALLSVLWSAAPRETLRHVLTLVWATLFGVYLAVRYSLNEQLRLLAWVLGIAALLSLVFALALPSYGVMGMSDFSPREAMAYTGAWQGIYINRNGLGRMMVLSSVVFLIVATSNYRYRWVAWAGFSLSVCLILLSSSKTSLAVLLILMVLLPLYRAWRWNYTLTVPFFISVILVGGGVAALLVINAETIVGAFGRDLTLTGRTAIWAAVLDKIWEHPLLGYGYGQFWSGWQSEAADVWRILGYEASNAHNGFLDLWLDLGLLGLSIFVLSFLGACLQALNWIRQTKTPEGIWPLAYLTFLLLANLTESSLLRELFLWILYVSVTLSIHNRTENLEGGILDL